MESPPTFVFFFVWARLTTRTISCVASSPVCPAWTAFEPDGALDRRRRRRVARGCARARRSLRLGLGRRARPAGAARSSTTRRSSSSRRSPARRTGRAGRGRGATSDLAPSPLSRSGWRLLLAGKRVAQLLFLVGRQVGVEQRHVPQFAAELVGDLVPDRVRGHQEERRGSRRHLLAGPLDERVVDADVGKARRRALPTRRRRRGRSPAR